MQKTIQPACLLWRVLCSNLYFLKIEQGFSSAMHRYAFGYRNVSPYSNNPSRIINPFTQLVLPVVHLTAYKKTVFGAQLSSPGSPIICPD